MSYFEELRQLWLAHGGAPDETRDPEDYGRWLAARMAEAKRPDSGHVGRGRPRIWQIKNTAQHDG